MNKAGEREREGGVERERRERGRRVEITQKLGGQDRPWGGGGV